MNKLESNIFHLWDLVDPINQSDFHLSYYTIEG